MVLLLLYACSSLVFPRILPRPDFVRGTLLSFATFAVGSSETVGGSFFCTSVIAWPASAPGLNHGAHGRRYRLMGALPTAHRSVLAPGCFWFGASRSSHSERMGPALVLLAVEHSPLIRRGLFAACRNRSARSAARWAHGFRASCKRCCHRGHRHLWWRVAFLLSVVVVCVGYRGTTESLQTPAFERVLAQGERSALPIREVFSVAGTEPRPCLGRVSRWAKCPFTTWGVFAIS